MKKDIYTVGPISPFEFDYLKNYCEKNAIEFEFDVDAELKAVADSRIEHTINGQYNPLTRRATPTFEYQSQKFIHFYINQIDSLRIVGALNLIATPINEVQQSGRAESQNSDVDEEDFMCPQCNFVTTAAGKCPTHGFDLMPYYDCLRFRSSQKSKWEKGFNFFLGYGIILFLIAVAVFVTYKIVTGT